MTYKNFDDSWTKKSKKPIELQAYGEKFKLPAELPAKFAIKINRLMLEDRKDEELKNQEMLDLVTTLFAKDDLERLLESGISINELGEIVQWACDQYGLQETEGEGKN